MFAVEVVIENMYNLSYERSHRDNRLGPDPAGS